MKNHRLVLLATLFTACLFSQQGHAAQTQQTTADNGWSFSANIDSIRLKKSSAYREWLGDSAYSLGAAAEYYQSETHLVYGVGLNAISYDDEASFSQQTNKGTKDSSANAIAFFAELGSRFWLGQGQENFVSVHGGFSALTASKRGIGYCSNCYSEDINIDGGAYGMLRFGHRFNSFDLSLHYQKFFSGDFDNAFGIKIATRF